LPHLRIHEPVDLLGPAEGGEPVAMGRGGDGQGDRFRRKSGVTGNPVSQEIRCQIIILARKDEPTPDYAP